MLLELLTLFKQEAQLMLTTGATDLSTTSRCCRQIRLAWPLPDMSKTNPFNAV